MTQRLQSAVVPLALVAVSVLPALGCASARGRAQTAAEVPAEEVVDPPVEAAPEQVREPVVKPPQVPVATRPPPAPPAPAAAPPPKPAAAPQSTPRLPEGCEGLTEYDCRRRQIERAGRAGKPGRLRDLVLDLDETLVEPAPTPVTTCWQHLKATVLVELDRVEEAKTAYQLIVDSCPVWESLNNLGVLEAGEGDFGEAKKLLREAAKKAKIDPRPSRETEYPARNLQNLQGSKETPFLTLVGGIGECAEQVVPRADCEGRITAVAALAPGGDEIEASFEVFRVADDPAAAEPVARSTGRQRRFETAVPSGTYRVAASVGKARTEERVTVGGGATVPVSLALDAGRLRAQWSLAPGGRPEPARFRVRRNGEVLLESAAPQDGISLIVPAGPYLVEAEEGRLTGAALLRVPAGGEVTVPLDPGVAAAVEGWRRAWSARDADGYLGAYVDRYTPDRETSNAAWAEERRRKIVNKASIEVGIREASFRRASGDKVDVRFVQDYRSTPKESAKKPFCSSGVKTLRLELVGEEWKISADSCEGCDDRSDCP